MKEDNMTLVEDYKHCEEIIKRHSKSFYAAFSILSKEKRNSVYAIYAFCRYADDSIDVLDSLDKLLDLEGSLDQFSQGKTPDTPVFRALEDTFERFDVDIEPFYHMIEGQKMDFEFTQPKDLEEFKRYCYHVAGAVGLMLLPIIASENKDQLRVVALGLGEAMQITNILRDVGEDYDQGRIYIPVDLLARFPKAIEAIETKVVNDDFIGAWEELATIAERNYSDFFHTVGLFDKGSQKAVANAALFYGEILNVVREKDYDCLTQKQYVSSFQALNIKLKRLINIS